MKIRALELAEWLLVVSLSAQSLACGGGDEDKSGSAVGGASNLGGSGGSAGTAGESGSGGMLGLGPGTLSGLPFKSGHWVNGGPDRDKDFVAWRGFDTDAVTQAMHGLSTWYEHGGASSEAELDAMFGESPASFTPTLKGIFALEGWRKHVWGEYPATEHRKKLIHLAWMDSVPGSVGNNNGKNPKLWYDIATGSGDKAMFVLGRSFAWLDATYGDPAEPMSFDFTYEWTLVSHTAWPSGTYTLNGTVRETYKDFPRGWSRLVRVFREGYAYQRGTACPYRFFWRPQLRFSVQDKNQQLVRHEQLWPNLAAADVIDENVTIDGVVVLPKGPLGAQANGVAVSWHDSSQTMVTGSSATESGNNWQEILDGFPTHWGLQEAADFARAEGVPFALPEWGARPPEFPPISPNPADVFRLTHWFILQNLDVFAYENVFDQNGANIAETWDPPQPAEDEPGTVYKSLWTP